LFRDRGITKLLKEGVLEIVQHGRMGKPTVYDLTEDAFRVLNGYARVCVFSKKCNHQSFNPTLIPYAPAFIQRKELIPLKFEEMALHESILEALAEMGLTHPTEIQLETIPLIKEGHDVIGQSETGSGKTIAFGAPLVEKTKRGLKIQVMVVAPTRELARQIAHILRKLSEGKGLEVQTVYGGVGFNQQIRGLKRAEIVVGTPGRILDLMIRGALVTDNIHTFVLDEADTMVDMGFITDMERIEANIPRDRQTLLFSATMPDTVKTIVERFAIHPQKVKTETRISPELLQQKYYYVKNHEKFSLLVYLLGQENPESALIFCNMRKSTDVLAQNLKIQGVKAEALYGTLGQNKREEILDKFHRGRTRYLVATNVAARGLDVADISHIFNYDIPDNTEDYINRIGRTARAGKTGVAISLVSEQEGRTFSRITHQFKNELARMELPRFAKLPWKDKPGRKKKRSYRRRGRRRF
jgi:ATP-dependent RNA helicase DeaD